MLAHWCVQLCTRMIMSMCKLRARTRPAPRLDPPERGCKREAEPGPFIMSIGSLSLGWNIIVGLWCGRTDYESIPTCCSFPANDPNMWDVQVLLVLWSRADKLWREACLTVNLRLHGCSLNVMSCSHGCEDFSLGLDSKITRWEYFADLHRFNISPCCCEQSRVR